MVRAYRRASQPEVVASRRVDPARSGTREVETASVNDVEQISGLYKADSLVRKVREHGGEFFYDPNEYDTLYLSVPDSSKGPILEAVLLEGLQPDEHTKTRLPDKTVY